MAGAGFTRACAGLRSDGVVGQQVASSAGRIGWFARITSSGSTRAFTVRRRTSPPR